jgi:hypothetical protein
MSVHPIGAPECPPTNGDLATVLDDDFHFHTSLRSFGVSVIIVRSEQGIVLEGVSRTFYGKQMAQELARKANLVVLANRIRVERAGNRNEP